MPVNNHSIGEGDMVSHEQPFTALRGGGKELQLYSDRLIVRNAGVSAWLYGTDERTILFREIDDVILFEGTPENAGMLKLSLRDEQLPIIVSYPPKQEHLAEAIRDTLDVNLRRDSLHAYVN
jgi:hypothetical protein